MLDLRIVRGPLAEAKARAVLSDYNRLIKGAIPYEHFERWSNQSPEGPAYHAFLETEEGKVVGHCCLFPFPLQSSVRRLTGAKAEYYFVDEDYRGVPVRGFEGSYKPAAILLLEKLYQHCRGEGWGPYLVSAPAQVDALHKMAGCRAVNFGLSECLLILRPWKAFRHTPNLSLKERLALLTMGTLQQVAWPLLRLMAKQVSCNGTLKPQDGLSFVCEPKVQEWRYPHNEYVQLRLPGREGGWLIAKKGSSTDYLRVCQVHLRTSNSSPAETLTRLVQEAKEQGAIGVRWALYDDGDAPALWVRAMQRMGFLCVRRKRQLLIFANEREWLNPERWVMSDVYVSFDG